MAAPSSLELLQRSEHILQRSVQGARSHRFQGHVEQAQQVIGGDKARLVGEDGLQVLGEAFQARPRVALIAERLRRLLSPHEPAELPVAAGHRVVDIVAHVFRHLQSLHNQARSFRVRRGRVGNGEVQAKLGCSHRARKDSTCGGKPRNRAGRPTHLLRPFIVPFPGLHVQGALCDERALLARCEAVPVLCADDRVGECDPLLGRVNDALLIDGDPAALGLGGEEEGVHEVWDGGHLRAVHRERVRTGAVPKDRALCWAVSASK